MGFAPGSLAREFTAEPRISCCQKRSERKPQFRIEGKAEIFDAAEERDIHGESARYSFVTAEKSPGNATVVVLSPVDPKDLPGFEGCSFRLTSTRKRTS